MSVADIIEKYNKSKQTGLSIEVLPPMKGRNLNVIFNTIESLREFDLKYVNITSHHSEVVRHTSPDGLTRKKIIRKRPGTVAVAAAIKHKFNLPVVPHVICSGFTRHETEYLLLDLNFLEIHDLLLLQGDKNKEHEFITSEPVVCNEYASDLILQVNEFNKGHFIDEPMPEAFPNKFSYGVAGYPEKHEDAPSMESDLKFLKAKVDAGADYIVTQMYFDNQHFFRFVDKCREMGITVPIIPGLKPINKKNQLTLIPDIFKTELPEEFAREIRKCKTDDQVKEVGEEWTIQQSKELIKAGVPMLHFYTLFASKSVRKIAEAVF